MHGAITISNLQVLLLLTAGVGGAVFITAEIFKRLFGMSSGAVIHSMVVLLTAAYSIASYALKYKQLPVEMVGLIGPSGYGVSQFIYKYSKYAVDFAPKVIDFLSKVANSLKRKPSAAATDAAVAAVSAPADIATEPAAAASNEVNF